jgi:Tol biopolymer transport system component
MEGMMRRTVLGFATTMVAAMLAACGVAMLAVKDPAQAADPGQNGRIAYVSHLPSGLHEIYTMKPNGTDRKQLTDDSVYDTSPVYSPSGTKIAFVGQGPDGTDRQLVVQDGRDPVWSPDGRKIAFTRDSHVYTVNPDGTSEREVPGTPPENGPSEILPDWGPKSP